MRRHPKKAVNITNDTSKHVYSLCSLRHPLHAMDVVLSFKERQRWRESSFDFTHFYALALNIALRIDLLTTSPLIILRVMFEPAAKALVQWGMGGG